jgi:hypothetical protein
VALRAQAPLPAPTRAASAAPSGASDDEPAAVIPERAVAFTDDLVAVAAETSVYPEPRWGSHRLGYLRLGAVVRRAHDPELANARCPGGWYRVAPRGYVCAGPLASLDPKDPRAVAADVRPRLDGMPYPYVMSRSPPPPLYARLPTRWQELRYEPDLAKHVNEGLGGGAWPAVDAVPGYLADDAPTLALGNAYRSPDQVFLGTAHTRSGFALLSTFDHLGRRFGLTPELEVVPLDRTRLVRASELHGVALDEGEDLPVGFAKRSGAVRAVWTDKGLAPGGGLPPRAAVKLTSATRDIDGRSYVVAADGGLFRAEQLIIARAPKHPPAWATDGVKWIEVSIPRQLLVAYEGTRAVYATLVSTGVGGTADPEETHATVQGMFKIYEKHVSVTMAGRQAADPFDLRDVPFVQYFSGGYALHGAYWHDDFGREHSHGCVNLAPVDAAWLFAWTDPHVPDDWHGVMSSAGTTVWVHD